MSEVQISESERALKRLANKGLSIATLGKHAGVDPRTAKNWIEGHKVHDLSEAKIVHFLLSKGIIATDVLGNLGLPEEDADTTAKTGVTELFMDGLKLLKKLEFTITRLEELRIADKAGFDSAASRQFTYKLKKMQRNLEPYLQLVEGK